jgi:hypothetical protein
MGGKGNVETVWQTLREVLARRHIDAHVAWPWVFPAPDSFRAVLEARGFRVTAVELIGRPTPLPGDIEDWLETFWEGFLALVPATDRPALVTEVRDALAPKLRGHDGRWTVDYVRLRFAAIKP